jgi:hypothetical protein
MVFPFLLPPFGSIVVSALFSPDAGSIGDGRLQVADVLARGLVSTLCILWSHLSSRFDTSSRSSFGASSGLPSLLCPAPGVVVRRASARSSMEEPDGHLRIGRSGDNPHPATSEVRALHARRI